MPQLAVLFCFRFAQTTTATLTATAGSGRCTDSGHLTRHAHAGKSRQQHAHTHTHVQHTNDSLRRRRCRLCRRYHLRRFAVGLSSYSVISLPTRRLVLSSSAAQQQSSVASKLRLRPVWGPCVHFTRLWFWMGELQSDFGARSIATCPTLSLNKEEESKIHNNQTTTTNS